MFYTAVEPAQGQQLLQRMTAQTQAAVSTTVAVSSAVVAGGYVTVTATTASDDTSQFFAGVEATATPV